MKKHLWLYFLLGVAAGLAAEGLVLDLKNQFKIYGRGADENQTPASLGPCIETNFGNWLAAQHAVFSDDFESAVKFLENMDEDKSEIVAGTRNLVVFLENGGLPPEGAVFGGELKKSNSAVWRIISSAGMAKSGKWKDLYNNFKNEKSQILAPFRIWSSVATGNVQKALDFIDKFPANNSWKDFVRGMIYAATKNNKRARQFFVRVPASFMNLLDYHLAMSFYKRHGFQKDSDALKKEWLNSPGGMYMADLELGENWADYDSNQKMLAVGLIQNVSHNGEAGFSESGLLALRTAAALGGQSDAINYYTGGYFFNAGSGNYKKYWAKLDGNPVYAPFIKMKNAEKTGDLRIIAHEMRDILKKHPLFLPAIQKIWRQNMQNGRENGTFRMLDRALNQDNIPDAGRAYILKMRGHAHYIFDEFEDAEKDLGAAAKLSPLDAGIMGLQVRVWAAQKKNLDEAYRYGISLIKAFPSNVENWSILALAIRAKEGDEPALELLERVGRVAEECSELFMQLGDLRARAGLSIGAGQAYRKAIALSGDGLIIQKEAEKKLRKVIK